METEKKVVDASIIVKWFLTEPGSVQALILRDKHVAGEIILVVPELVFIEVINVLRYKNKNISELGDASKFLWDLQLTVEKLNEFFLSKAVEIAVKYQLSVYDGIYAFLSQKYGIPLVIADKQLQRIPNSEILSS